MSHEPLSINNRLITELFEYLLQVLGSRYYPTIPIRTPTSAAPLQETRARGIPSPVSAYEPPLPPPCHVTGVPKY